MKPLALYWSSLLVCFLWGLMSCKQPKEATSTAPPPATDYLSQGKIVAQSPELGELIPLEGRMEILARGFVWSEGPLWLPEQKMLIWSDVPQNTIYGCKLGGPTQVFLSPSGYTQPEGREGESGSNGLALDEAGNLLLCQHGNRQLARMEAPLNAATSDFTALATHYEGKRFNSPNDLVLSKSGSIFFTDPPYGLEKQMDDPRKELVFQGVYRLDPDGQVSLVTDQLSRPNGIGLSPDNRTLYVANSDPERAIWMAYALDEEENVVGEKLLYDATPEVGPGNPGLPDGLKVDEQGNIFATGPGGVWVFNAEGNLLGNIRTGLPTSNCALGGGNLFLTADSLILKLPLLVK